MNVFRIFGLQRRKPQSSRKLGQVKKDVEGTTALVINDEGSQV